MSEFLFGVYQVFSVGLFLFIASLLAYHRLLKRLARIDHQKDHKRPPCLA